MNETILHIDQLTMQFGGIKAVNNLSMQIPKSSIVALIGPNGAGKTTVFNMLTGVYQPTQGKILYANQNLKGLKPYHIARLGIARTFQNIRLFKDLSVLDNVRLGHDIHHRQNLFNVLLQSNNFMQDEKKTLQKSLHLLEIFKLEQDASKLARNLPYGAQRKLEIARAIATGAQLLLLDEPAAGMNSQETKSLMETLQEVRKEFDLTILLIEHDMRLVMGISEKIWVLDYGEKIAEGKPQEIQNNPKVVEAYLGRAKK